MADSTSSVEVNPSVSPSVPVGFARYGLPGCTIPCENSCSTPNDSRASNAATSFPFSFSKPPTVPIECAVHGADGSTSVNDPNFGYGGTSPSPFTRNVPVEHGLNPSGVPTGYVSTATPPSAWTSRASPTSTDFSRL